MKDTNIIVSETNRPYWQLPIAAIFFTAAIFLLFVDISDFNWSNDYLRNLSIDFQILAVLIFLGTYFSSQKRIYIDLENSRFKPSTEIGFLKFGRWKTIHNYEYVSIFYDVSKNIDERFEVNLWYDKNKHFELYARNNFEDAITVAYNLSEALNIDLLDATIPNDFKWIDKEALKAEHSK